MSRGFGPDQDRDRHCALQLILGALSREKGMETRRRLSIVTFLAFLMPVLPSWAEPLPHDVQRFLDRREGCDHLRGEIDRMDAVSREIRTFCAGTDKELVQLKRKYASNSTIMQILNQFETGIEAARRQ
jgi:hypothetical protein